ncbi:hypothetical protein Acor_24590 [Acrocarpospora corrugata]|uniref:CBM2 domain-containing protein n=2 Tax=Acrocarpospora corrugata TaxID=35763 RepID=A0A5M3VUB8_9ACTN|nr:hypothetical protein Acor_24590 [Acrocarpospora corrugata]
MLVALVLGAGVMLGAPGPADAAATTVSYRMAASWGLGFQAQLTVTPSAAVTSWTIEFDLAAQQVVTAAFFADFTQTGQHVVLSNRPFNGAVPAGGALSLGIQVGNPGLINVPPGAFTFNGQPATYTPEPYLLASIARVQIPEGGTVSFNVRISQIPVSPIVVELGGGDASQAVVVTPRQLTFSNNPRFWNLPQTVVVTRLDDPGANGQSVFIPITQWNGKPGYAMEAVIADLIG